MATLIKLRRDITANWESVNPILSNGEPGLETNTNKLKIGNGTDAWNDLDYIAGESEGSTAYFSWDGTLLGVREEGETEYTYVDLQGPAGTDGVDGVMGSYEGIWTETPLTNYNINDVTDHNDITWVSNVDSNESEPGTNDDWRPVVNNITSGSGFGSGVFEINKTTSFNGYEIDFVETANDNTIFKEEIWYYETYPLIFKVYQSLDSGVNFTFKGESIVNYTPDKLIAGHVWWEDKNTDNYLDLIKAFFHGGGSIEVDTTWDNFVDSDQMEYLADNSTSMTIFSDSTEAVTPLTTSTNAMNKISSSSVARTVIGLTGTLFNAIIESSMAVGKFIAGHSSITPDSYATVTELLADDTVTDNILDSESAIDVLLLSSVAREEAISSADFTIGLAYHDQALDQMLVDSNFMSELSQNAVACEHLVDTDFARAKLFANEHAFDIFINNPVSMESIASYATSSTDVFEDVTLLGKVLDSPTARVIAFSQSIFVGNIIYDDTAMQQLVDHEYATLDIVDISVMMEAVVYDTPSITKFVEDATTLNRMIYSENANTWIKDSSAAIDVLDANTPTTVPVLAEAGTDEFASSFYSLRPPFQAFNNNSSNWWESEGGNVANEYIGYEFATNVWCYKVDIKGTNTTACLNNCKVQYYSAESTEWIDATDTFSVVRQDTSVQTFNVCHPIKSNKWRLFILNNHGSSLRIELPQLQFYCQ